MVSQIVSRYREWLNAISASFSLPEGQESVNEAYETTRQDQNAMAAHSVSGRKRIKTRTNYICIGGAFIVHPSPVKIYERFDIITLDIPDHQKIIFEGEVTWNNMSLPVDTDISRAMGGRFVGISNDSRESRGNILLECQAEGPSLSASEAK